MKGRGIRGIYVYRPGVVGSLNLPLLVALAGLDALLLRAAQIHSRWLPAVAVYSERAACLHIPLATFFITGMTCYWPNINTWQCIVGSRQ